MESLKGLNAPSKSWTLGENSVIALPILALFYLESCIDDVRLAFCSKVDCTE